VPEEFRALYDGLDERLAAFEQTLPPADAPPAFEVTCAAELLTANGHRGEELLTDACWQGNLLMLERLQQLGIWGITIQVSYPLLTSDFPRHDEYLAFYKRVADEVRRRGLKLLAKTGPMFTQPEFARQPISYEGLTVDEYIRRRIEQNRLIAEELKPDYLTIANEPTSERQVTGLTLTGADQMRYIQATLAEVKDTGVAVGAGTGTWDTPRYVQAFAGLPDLAYVDLHVYPIYGGYLEQAREMARIAHAGGKRVIIGESWLYKSLGDEPGESAAATWAPIFGRDVFSFWQPLDERYIRALVTLAHTENIEYLSLFWTKYLFAYADYDATTSALTPGELLRLGDREAARNMMAGTYSKTGEVYGELAGGDE